MPNGRVQTRVYASMPLEYIDESENQSYRKEVERARKAGVFDPNNYYHEEDGDVMFERQDREEEERLKALDRSRSEKRDGRSRTRRAAKAKDDSTRGGASNAC